MTNGRERPEARDKAEREERAGVQAFMDRITPMLQDWLRENLLSMGLPGHTEGDNRSENRPAKRAQKGGKKRTDPTPSGRANPTNKGVLGEGVHATVVPNPRLFSEVVEEKTKEGTHQPQAQGAQAQREIWTEVTGGEKEEKKIRTNRDTTPLGGTGPQGKRPQTKRTG